MVALLFLIGLTIADPAFFYFLNPGRGGGGGHIVD